MTQFGLCCDVCQSVRYSQIVTDPETNQTKKEEVVEHWPKGPKTHRLSSRCGICHTPITVEVPLACAQCATDKVATCESPKCTKRYAQKFGS